MAILSRRGREPREPAEAVASLRADGVRLVMMTGDNRVTARAVARTLGIEDVEAEVQIGRAHV